MHLRMTGVLLLDPPPDAPYVRVRFVLDGGAHEIRFCDPRRFGTGEIALGTAARDAFFAPRLGLEPLSDELTGAALRAMARGRRAPIKAFLLDQRRVAGVGQHLRRRGAVPRADPPAAARPGRSSARSTTRSPSPSARRCSPGSRRAARRSTTSATPTASAARSRTSSSSTAAAARAARTAAGRSSSSSPRAGGRTRASTASPGRACGGRGLVVEQRALDVEAAAEAGERAVRADEAVAGEDDRQRVAAVRRADRARGPRRAEPVAPARRSCASSRRGPRPARATRAAGTRSRRRGRGGGRTPCARPRTTRPAAVRPRPARGRRAPRPRRRAAAAPANRTSRRPSSRRDERERPDRRGDAGEPHAPAAQRWCAA